MRKRQYRIIRYVPLNHTFFKHPFAIVHIFMNIWLFNHMHDIFYEQYNINRFKVIDEGMNFIFSKYYTRKKLMSYSLYTHLVVVLILKCKIFISASHNNIQSSSISNTIMGSFSITLIGLVTISAVFGQVFRLPEKQACQKSKYEYLTLSII